MDTIHLHLLLNHIPVLGTMLALALLLFALPRQNVARARDALRLLVGLGIVAVIVYLTGGAAEEGVEDLPGVSESLIETHEEAALAATIALGVLAVGAIAALWRYRTRTLPRWVTLAGFAGTLVVAGMMGWTANLGGQIRHSEIRSGAATTTAEGEAGGERNGGDRERGEQ
ncbi:MAG TPA: hypothetical protein VHM30_07005 [Gemmatimonadaceae bacterium]|nr:hypothetical protein [Gemmatimonadaceae bacterium]